MIGKCNMYVIMCLFFSKMHRQNARIWRGQSMIEPSFELALWVSGFHLYKTSFIMHGNDNNDTETY